jgi:hypothetical protein
MRARTKEQSHEQADIDHGNGGSEWPCHRTRLADTRLSCDPGRRIALDVDV